MTQLLIVHRDPEIGRDLVQLVKDYTGYESVLTQSESETLFWLRRQPEVRLRWFERFVLERFGRSSFPRSKEKRTARMRLFL